MYLTSLALYQHVAIYSNDKKKNRCMIDAVRGSENAIELS